MMRKHGLANQSAFLVGAIDNRKVTPGITELSPARVHIDLEACYFDVVSSYPGGAAAAKGGVVRPLKGIVRWVYTVVRQVCCFSVEVSKVLEGKDPLVREEQGFAATSLPVVWQGTAGQPRCNG